MAWFKKRQEQVATPEKAGSPVRQNLNELVLKAVHEGVVIVDAAGNIRLANPAAEAMLGRSAEELIGINHASVISLLDKTGASVGEASNPISRALKDGQFSETRNLDLLATKSNKVTPVSIMIAPTKEEWARLVITLRDIAKELKEERERNDFISTASHEMRTPVASIEGYLSLAMNAQTATIDERAKSYLEKAHEAAQHLGRLFQNLLDVTKFDDGQIKPRLGPVELVGLVKKIADAQAPHIQSKGLQYQFGSDSVDGKTINQLIYASVDEDFLREVIDNLIENAIKYTPAGWISVSVSADSYNVRITVTDTGIGIPREELAHVFQKFYRVDNRDTREIGGTGLGLYLAKQRVEAMNGKVWAESEVGRGTKFIVMLPRLSRSNYEQQAFLKQNQNEQAKNRLQK